MACEPIHETPPRKMNTACPEAVYVTGGLGPITCLLEDIKELLQQLVDKDCCGGGGGGGELETDCCGEPVEFRDCNGNVIGKYNSTPGESLEFKDCDGNIVARFTCSPCDPLTLVDCAGNILITLGA